MREQDSNGRSVEPFVIKEENPPGVKEKSSLLLNQKGVDFKMVQEIRSIEMLVGAAIFLTLATRFDIIAFAVIRAV